MKSIKDTAAAFCSNQYPSDTLAQEDGVKQVSVLPGAPERHFLAQSRCAASLCHSMPLFCRHACALSPSSAHRSSQSLLLSPVSRLQASAPKSSGFRKVRIHALACSPAVAASSGFTARVRAARPAQLARLPTHLPTTRRRARAAPPAPALAEVQDFVDTGAVATWVAIFLTLAPPTAILLVAVECITDRLIGREEASQQAAADDAQPARQEPVGNEDQLAPQQGLADWQVEIENRLAALEAELRVLRAAVKPADEAADS